MGGGKERYAMRCNKVKKDRSVPIGSRILRSTNKNDKCSSLVFLCISSDCSACPHDSGRAPRGPRACDRVVCGTLLNQWRRSNSSPRCLYLVHQMWGRGLRSHLEIPAVGLHGDHPGVRKHFGVRNVPAYTFQMRWRRGRPTGDPRPTRMSAMSHASVAPAWTNFFSSLAHLHPKTPSRLAPILTGSTFGTNDPCTAGPGRMCQSERQILMSALSSKPRTL
ncbi:hypothetical protein PLICRDRAFT_549788 [Plicaturopsis crispa FD-325 SS-3]|nr:hypothetical protein PLICRDRAFT_549788 [Plicaturopsis crispa FD-325 SS-3]